jgi:hypothetical protein
MTASTLPLAAEALATLTGFLRGVERRAAVFAELACGSPQQGDAAVEATLHAFCQAAARGPLADWDVRFWNLLLSTPQLRLGAREGHWPAPWTKLASLGPGVRSALLLRLVAGLDDAHAGHALGVAPATFVMALQRGLGERHAPAESARWQALVLASRQQLRQLPGERLVRLARAREDALLGRAPKPRRRPADWRMPLLWAGVAACVLAFLASFVLPGSGRDSTPEVGVSALPPVEAPLARFDADTALLTHRDFDQLTASPAQSELARELDFYAWYAAQDPEGTPALGSAAPGATAVEAAHASD